MARSLVLSVVLNALLTALLAYSQGAARHEPQPPVFSADSHTAITDAEILHEVDVLEHQGFQLTHCEGAGYHQNSLSVAEFIGANVKSVRVVHVVPANYLLSQRMPPALETVKKVWAGRFNSVECVIPWAEMTFWNVEAIVKFEDGTEAKLITDGVHVAFQDHSGRSWFVRLLPAGQ